MILCGRLTKDPDVRYSSGANQTAIARYNLAVDRTVRREDGTQEADFISCVAFGKNGEFAEKYLRKGMKILVEGRIQTGSYTNRDGQKVYTTDVVVEHHEFVESRQQSQQEAPAAVPAQRPEPSYAQSSMDDFMPIPDDVADEGLPFA